jgi:hypothetical protein
VKASIQQIDTWDDVKSGYMSLLWYLCSVLIFVIILSLQLQVPRSFTVDFALREVVLEQVINIKHDDTVCRHGAPTL